MSVMSFLHALENNLAIWILSITPCLRALPGRSGCFLYVCVQRGRGVGLNVSACVFVC